MNLNFKNDILLENERVRLEPLNWEHFEFLLPIALEYPDLLKYSPPNFGTEEFLKTYFENNLKLRDNGEKYPFIIYDKIVNCYAGSTSFMNISNENRRIEIGSTWLGKKFQRTGLNKNCKFLLLQYVFKTLGFERVEFKTDKRNKQSQKSILAIGASYEGLLRSHMVMADGYRRDTAYYSILKNEWNEIRRVVFQKEN